MTNLFNGYLRMGGSEIDVRIIRVGDTTAISIRIVCSGEILDVSISPCVDTKTEKTNSDCEEHY